MIRSTIIAILAAWFMFSPTSAFCGGLIYKVPEDGISALYRVENSAKPAPPSLPVGVKISCVGTTTIDGQSCRWIEIDLQRKGHKPTETEVLKLLIPEDKIGEGTEPLKHVIKAWRRPSGPNVPGPQAINDVKESLELQNLKLFLHEMYNGVKEMGEVTITNESITELEKVTVDCALGEVECHGVRKEATFTRNGMAQEVSYTVLLHDDAPFGVVSMEVTMTPKVEGNGAGKHTLKFVLKEIGKNEASVLPDSR